MDTLVKLHAMALDKRDADPSSSYTASLYKKGRLKIAQKVGEEALEVALAAVSAPPGAVIAESADLLYHLAVLWAECGIEPKAVIAELEKREGISGLVEKAQRPLSD
jgi:phosphoribosyl-ATP pyrophosphohydrolase